MAKIDIRSGCEFSQKLYVIENFCSIDAGKQKICMTMIWMCFFFLTDLLYSLSELIHLKLDCEYFA